MLGEQLRTGNHARFAKGRQPHRLRGIEFGVLKCCETDQTIDQRRRQRAPIDVHLIAQDHLDPLRDLADDRLLGSSPRRRSHPRLLIVVVEWKAYSHDPSCSRRLRHQVGDLGSAHAPEARQESPLVVVWSQFVIYKDTVALLPWSVLQRQRNQVAEPAGRHGVLAGKEPIIRFEPQIGAALHRLRHQMGTELARLGCRHRFREENPDMTAIAGAGALKGCGHTLLPACCQERQRVTLPRLLVEIGGQEPTGLVRHERIDACDERLRSFRDWQRPAPADGFSQPLRRRAQMPGSGNCCT